MSNSLLTPTPPSKDYDYSLLYKSPAGIQFHKDWFKKGLKDLKVPYERLYIETRFGSSHVLAAGPLAAPPLILISGTLDTSLEWIRQFHLFARAGTYRRIYALDVPGWSPVSAPAGLSALNLEYGMWLVEMMYGLGIQRADFVGLGSGCGFIFKLAALTPGRISSAILMHPPGIVPMHSYSSPLHYFTVLGAVLFPRPALVRRLIQRNLAPQTRLNETLMQQNIEHFQMCRKYLKVGPSYGILKDEDLKKLNAPCLVLNGQYDKFHNQTELTARLRRLLPRVHFEVVPEAGWPVETEQPAYINAAINNFLNYTAGFYKTTFPTYYPNAPVREPAPAPLDTPAPEAQG